jgi:hypothetical protein
LNLTKRVGDCPRGNKVTRSQTGVVAHFVSRGFPAIIRGGFVGKFHRAGSWLSFFVLENVIGIANALVFIFVNLRLLFRDQIVNTYRIIGAVNVYLLFALMGALTLEVIHAATGVSIGGNVVLKGMDDDYVHFIYFSLASLTTVGFGDIYAVNAP